MKLIKSRHKHGPHPEEVARSLLRVTVSKDGRRKRRPWPSHSESKTRVNALMETTRVNALMETTRADARLLRTRSELC
jgi:hypothetical protein